MHFSTLINSLALFAATGLAGYVLEDDYFQNGFFNQFSFWDSSDPTHGFVDYVPYQEAVNSNLVSESSNNAVMRVDSTSVTPNGRPSVRITSNKSYNFGLIVVDIEHMPGGICGTWPAFWMLGPNWPYTGEIDIIEGVNAQTIDDMTLHTGPGCTINNNGGFSGRLVSTNCVSSNGDNDGCQIAATNSNTYGSQFNANGGGVYATEWTDAGIKIYFFPRGSVPSDALGDSPDPAGWGTPVAYFTGSCNYATNFQNLQIVFDTTFCGDWAGNVWASGTCAGLASSCNSYVENNPSAFTNAYWSVNALRVYQNNGQAEDAEAAVVAGSTPPTNVTQPATTAAVATTPTTFVVSTTAAVTSAAPSQSESEPVVVGNGGRVGEGNVAAPAAQAVATNETPAIDEFTSGPGGLVAEA